MRQNICCGYFAFDRTKKLKLSRDKHNKEKHMLRFRVMA